MASLKKGQIVRSLAGRDKGQILIVVDRFDSSHVLIVDGKRRLLDKPKKKKEKHLQDYKTIIDEKEMVNDCRIRKIIQMFEKDEEVR
ncbi:MAG: KOW domain-containing protein [Gallicola sp.]|nr:KOW domain-containing protein [Gallicola sp.]